MTQGSGSPHVCIKLSVGRGALREEGLVSPQILPPLPRVCAVSEDQCVDPRWPSCCHGTHSGSPTEQMTLSLGFLSTPAGGKAVGKNLADTMGVWGGGLAGVSGDGQVGRAGAYSWEFGVASSAAVAVLLEQPALAWGGTPVEDTGCVEQGVTWGGC